MWGRQSRVKKFDARCPATVSPVFTKNKREVAELRNRKNGLAERGLYAVAAGAGALAAPQVLHVLAAHACNGNRQKTAPPFNLPGPAATGANTIRCFAADEKAAARCQSGRRLGGTRAANQFCSRRRR